MSKTFLFQTIQLSISTKSSSTLPIDRTLSGATTAGQGEPGSDGNEGVHCISQSTSVTGASPSDCLVSYTGHSLGDAVSVFNYPSHLGAEITQGNQKSCNI